MSRTLMFIALSLALHCHLESYSYNPHVGKDIWESVTPYFLPDDHPVKKKLDQLFKHSRVTRNKNTMLRAKFKHLKESPWSHTVCAKHEKLRGYVIKAYYDEGPSIPDWSNWINRIKGAEAVQHMINKRHGYQHIFKVAKKWIYPLPTDPSPPKGVSRKNFILVVEDMHVHRRKDSLRKWKGIAISAKKLNAVYTMLRDLGLRDSVYAFNLPFSKDGRIVFVDTEHHHEWPVRYEKLLPYLSPKMKIHWQGLIDKG